MERDKLDLLDISVSREEVLVEVHAGGRHTHLCLLAERYFDTWKTRTRMLLRTYGRICHKATTDQQWGPLRPRSRKETEEVGLLVGRGGFRPRATVPRVVSSDGSDDYL